VSRRISSPTFIARREELARLEAAFAEVAAGHPVAVLIGGEAGVGKTRLVAQFAAAAVAAGARVLRGGAVPVGEGSLAYGPIVEALRRPLRQGGRDALSRKIEPVRSELGSLLPGLAESGSEPTTIAPAPRPAARDRERLLEVLLDVLRRMSEEAPIVLVTEDAHWADRATLDALSFLHRNLTDERVLLLVTYRTDDVGPDHPLRSVLAELERAGRTEWFEIGRFDRIELGRLLAGILGEEPDPRLLDRTYLRTGGNAYYAEELMALGGADQALPSSLQDVLLARIGGLGAQARSLLRTASAMGPRFDGKLVSLVDGLDREASIAALREATAHHIVIPVAGSGEQFEFRHALVAEAVYASLLPVDRVRLHASWARVLEDRVGAPPDRVVAAQLAHHWLESGDLSRALAAAMRAGMSARRERAFADARLQFERALDLWPGVPSAAELAGMDREALLELTAEAALYAGSAAAAVGHLRSATEMVEEDTDPIHAGLVYERLAFAAGRAGMADEARAARTEALRLVPEEPETAARARVLAGSANERLLSGEMTEAADFARRSIAIAGRVDSPETEADALATLGAALGQLGELGEALPTMRRGRELARQAGDILSLSRAWGNLAALLEGEERIREAMALVEWSDRVGLGHSSGSWTRCLAAMSMIELGRCDEAEQTLARVRLAVPEDDAERFLWLARATLDLRRGRIEAATDAVAHLQSTGARYRDQLARLNASELQAEIHLACGRWADARAAARAVADELAAQPLGAAAMGCSAFLTAIRAEAEGAIVARARHDEAGVREAADRGARILERVRSIAAAMAGDRAAHWRRPAAIAALCEAEWSRLSGASDATTWAAAADACAKADQVALRPYALFRQAEALLATRRGRTAAAPVLLEAHQVASRMGAALQVADIEDLARRGRIALDSSAPPPSRADSLEPQDGFGLTRREREVLAMVADGRTNREIARALFITEGTASVHVSNVLGKLGVGRRAEAAALAVQLGLVEVRSHRHALVDDEPR